MSRDVLAVRTGFEPLRTLGWAAIGAAYVPVGTAIDHPAHAIVIQNFTDITLFFSFDGVNDHLILTSEDSLVLDLASDRTISSTFLLANHTRLYVRSDQIPAKAGDVWFSVIYGAGV